MRTKILAVVMISCFAFEASVLCTHVSGQDKPAPPQREVNVEGVKQDSSDEAQLPKISLPEFDITGHEIVSLGAGTKGLSEDRWTARGTTLADPGKRESPMTSLGSTATPQLQVGAAGFTGRVYGGFGSFRTPSFDMRLGVLLPSTGFLLKSGYKSSSGHVPFADYREGHVALTANTRFSIDSRVLREASLSADLGFRGKSFQFYGSPTPDLQRTLKMVGGSIAISSEAGQISYKTGFELRAFNLSDSSRSEEREASIFFEGERPIDPATIKVSANFWRDSHVSASYGQNPFINTVSVSVLYPVGDRIQLNGGLALYHMRGSLGSGAVRVLPAAGVSWLAEDWLSLFARFSPTVQRFTLSALVERNPYVAADAFISHPESSTDVTIGASVEPGRNVRGTTTFKYQQVKNFPLFVESSAGGVWDVEYFGRTRVVEIQGELSVDLTETEQVSLSALFRNTENSETNSAVPYTPKAQLSAMYRYLFPIGITLEARVRVVGSHHTDLNATNSIPGFVLCDLLAEYGIIPRLTAGCTIENLFNDRQERWRGYAGFPRSGTLFVRYNW